MKKYTGLSVLRGMWRGDQPIDQGAEALMGDDSSWSHKPLLAGHMDGLAVPPGILNTGTCIASRALGGYGFGGQRVRGRGLGALQAFGTLLEW